MPTGKDVLAVAASQLGYREGAGKRNKFGAWYGMDGVAWCMEFVQWCYARSGVPLPIRTASCGALLRWYRAHHPECIVTEPRPGDIVIFDFPGGAATDHTGIFESAAGDYVTSIDGNTSNQNDANGGHVNRRMRKKDLVRAYIRPRELEEDMKRFNTIEEIKKDAPWALDTVEKLIRAKALGGNGAGLDVSEDMLRAFVVNDRMGLYK